MSTAIQQSSVDQLTVLLNSRHRAILVKTFEEQRFIENLQHIAQQKGYANMYYWSITSGLVDGITGKPAEGPKADNPMKLFDIIAEAREQNIYVIRDFHDIWTNAQAKRKLRDYLESKTEFYKPIILTSPEASIPLELEKLITLINFDLPDRDRVKFLLDGNIKFLESKDLPTPKGREYEAIIHALVGMTEHEISNILRKTTSKHKAIVLAEIVAEKEQVIRKTGLLEYITKLGDMDNVGAMDRFKEWTEDAYYAFHPDAQQYNVDPVRGVVLAGVPGTGKSLAAKSIAHQWNLPLLKMNMSDIMDSKVGQSEKNISRALKLSEQVSPCVLWMDEFEKGLSGMSSSDKSDSGTLSRVVQEILTWLSEKEKPVFVIATANDITKLPPELTRAGRFDEIMFVSLPHTEERAEILAIHLKKRGYSITNDDFEHPSTLNKLDILNLAEKMKDFTGAEIEQAVSEAGRRAYAAFRKGQREKHYITVPDLEEQANKIVPIAKRNPQLINDLREWAKHSAVCVSSTEHDFLHSGGKTEENKSGSTFRVFGTDLEFSQ
ncbi:AAA family ATPase (plasmid) [Paenibacillus urinalis]|uniref:Uncharacterized AAA domain-containing protein ycf46 n=1 Tax=Paenibacillus urinalis TaxID=521520 RepID=A0ABY7XHI6_9BACL|nr:AAA family ATPase [Paenibacillus urinalis]WDI05225.1 AAA family ATPase [Paenibacillus urinalis]